MAITFNFQTPTTLRDRKVLKLFIGDIFKKEGKTFSSMTFIFCSDEYLLEINRQFLQHDYYTDIITFNLSESIDAPVSGEIYISIERVKDNAKTHNTDFNTELHRVIFHGVLHLCEYKDESGKDKKQMTFKEDEYLSLYF